MMMMIIIIIMISMALKKHDSSALVMALRLFFLKKPWILSVLLPPPTDVLFLWIPHEMNSFAEYLHVCYCRLPSSTRPVSCASHVRSLACWWIPVPSGCAEVPDHLKCLQEVQHSTLPSTTWANARLPSRMHLMVWTHSTEAHGRACRYCWWLQAHKPFGAKMSYSKAVWLQCRRDTYRTNQREQKCSVNKSVFSP